MVATVAGGASPAASRSSSRGGRGAGTKVTVVNYGRMAFEGLRRTDAFRINEDGGHPERPDGAVPLTLHVVIVGRGRAEAGFLTCAAVAGYRRLRAARLGKLAERMKVAGF